MKLSIGGQSGFCLEEGRERGDGEIASPEVLNGVCVCDDGTVDSREGDSSFANRQCARMRAR